jgi:hypothetical protein
VCCSGGDSRRLAEVIRAGSSPEIIASPFVRAPKDRRGAGWHIDRRASLRPELAGKLAPVSKN